MNAKPIAGLILAAGTGSRMGSLKPLLEFKGKPVIEHVVNAAADGGLKPVVVVLGFGAQNIRERVAFKGTQVVINPYFERGQSSSLQTGLGVVPSCCAAVMFLLGDQPLVDRRVVSRLLVAYRSFNPQLVIPTYAGKRGNPVIVDRHLFSELRNLTGDTGARALFEPYARQVLEVPMPDDGILFDIDTPADYARLLELEQKTAEQKPAGKKWV